jgi:hypothetical protein
MRCCARSVAGTSEGAQQARCQTDAVLPWHATGYAFIKREGDGGGAWVSLERVASPIMTAAR